MFRLHRVSRKCLVHVSFLHGLDLDLELDLDKYHRGLVSVYHSWVLWQRVKPLGKNGVSDKATTY